MNTGATIEKNVHIYDGWNLIGEMNVSGSLIREYVWGLDLSDTEHGAGGVGGLLMVTDASGSYYAGYDGNGNVVALVDSSDGSVDAVYEYDPFGNALRATGSMADANPFRFSTKYTEQESGLVYYGYRFYSPGLGRWLNRDPIGEDGGANTYNFVSNAAIGNFDVLGLLNPKVFWFDWGDDERQRWFDRFKKKHRRSICAAAKRHCIPGDLLAAILANEQIDYSLSENVLEVVGFGKSVGIGQISIDTAIDYGLTDCNRTQFHDYVAWLNGEMYVVTAEQQLRSCVRSRLQRNSSNIEASARLMKRYLDLLCLRAQEGSLSKGFQTLTYGCSIDDFCCRRGGANDQCWTMNSPSCLMAALAAAWNNGIGITEVQDPINESPYGDSHAGNASFLDNYVEGFCE